MSLPSNYLDAFFVCAQTGHFTKAAKNLGLTQSALSQRILKLEDELETTLIIRGRSGLRLTEAGQVLLRYCQTRASLEEEVLAGIRSETSPHLSGHVRIGGFSSVTRSVLLPALGPLFKKNPDLRLHVLTEELHILPDLLKTGQIDFMVLDKELNQPGLESHWLGWERSVLVESSSTKVQDYILDHDEQDETSIRYLKMIRKSTKVQRRFLGDVYGIIDAVKLGLGRAILPRHLIRQEKQIRVLNEKELKTPVFLHYPTQPYYSRLHKAVLEQLEENTEKFLPS